MTHFVQIRLRTNDVERARAFYASVLGDVPIPVVQLHEQAVARGARPHWLGFLAVADVDRAAATFSQRGALALGPKWVDPEGLEAATFRDPGGALIALAKPPPQARPTDGTSAAQSGAPVVWHLLNTADVAQAKANYGELFGWEFHEPLDLGSHGVLHPFACERGAAAIGAMSDIASRPGVHAHWLFHFRVAALEPAVQTVRDAGGSVLGPIRVPSGEHIAICDDPQGAAFALRV